MLDPQQYRYFLITMDGLVERQRIIGDELNGNINYLFVHETKLHNVADLLAPAS